MRERGLETVTIVRPSAPDRYGDSASTTEFDIPGCAVLPDAVGLEIQTFQQDVLTTDFTVLMPAGSDVVHTDKVRVRGTVYGIEGEPTLLKSPITGRAPWIQVKTGGIVG